MKRSRTRALRRLYLFPILRGRLLKEEYDKYFKGTEIVSNP